MEIAARGYTFEKFSKANVLVSIMNGYAWEINGNR